MGIDEKGAMLQHDARKILDVREASHFDSPCQEGLQTFLTILLLTQRIDDARGMSRCETRG